MRLPSSISALALAGVLAFPAAPRAQAGDVVQTAASTGQFTTLLSLVKSAGLEETLKGEGPFTVLAPDDRAFGKIGAAAVNDLRKPENADRLKAILTYHVVPQKAMAADVTGMDSLKTVNGATIPVKVDGETVRLSDATVTRADVAADNGVIHVIDAVLMPPEDGAEDEITPAAEMRAERAGQDGRAKPQDGGPKAKTIPEVAAANGSFGTLLAAAKAAGLAETLGGEGPFTVFAPTDAAFEKLPEGTVDDLLKPANRDKLVSVLKYHVVLGRVNAKQALQAGEATTLEGGTLEIAETDDGATVGGAKLVQTDVKASNGLIHVIDAVLMPPSE